MVGMSGTTEPEVGAAGAAPATPHDWRAFLEEYGQRYLMNHDGADELLDEDQADALDRGERIAVWLGAEPAREEVLAAAEERIGLRLPPSLRSFFLTSDGWEHLDGWVDGVHPSGRAGWMRDSEDGARVIEVYASIAGNEDDVSLFRRSVEIAKGEDYWLLDPTDVGPDGEWAAYEFTPKYGDTTRFPSFAAMFHSSFEDMDEGGDEDDDED
ncbi:SMI1/KNR4 family protein [Streptomyces cyaneofuscatus]|uniref:SMI1/KNR4 family protein n=1 Tax=Streptomyces cyaneofuscatus TaxID=66883 RepID=UPI00365BEADA